MLLIVFAAIGLLGFLGVILCCTRLRGQRSKEQEDRNQERILTAHQTAKKLNKKT